MDLRERGGGEGLGGMEEGATVVMMYYMRKNDREREREIKRGGRERDDCAK